MSYETSSYNELSHDRIIQDKEFNPVATTMGIDKLMVEMIREYEPQLYEKLQKTANQNAKLRQICSNKDIEIFDLKEKISELENNQPEKIETNSQPKFDYAINRRVWQNNNKQVAPIQYVQRLSDQLLKLTEQKDLNGKYIINNKKDLAPIYLVLQQSAKLPFHYSGDIPDFVFFWNDNVAARIKDESRAENLTCNANSLKTVINNKIWSNVSITSWGILSLESKNTNEYQLGDNLKKKIEAFTF